MADRIKNMLNKLQGKVQRDYRTQTLAEMRRWHRINDLAVRAVGISLFFRHHLTLIPFSYSSYRTENAGKFYLFSICVCLRSVSVSPDTCWTNGVCFFPQKMDKNRDGVVTLDEFILSCQEVHYFCQCSFFIWRHITEASNFADGLFNSCHFIDEHPRR